jgi:hypothetical protein
MGFFGLFGTSGKVVASVGFGFRPDFEATYRVSVSEKGIVPEGFENWIWDLFYAKALYTIGKSQIADRIKSQLETWAEEHAPVLLSGFPVPTNFFWTLDPDLEITHSGHGVDEEVCELVIIERGPSRRNPKAWPTIETRFPRRGFQNRYASAVLGLAQHLMAGNAYFTWMLSFHILSMKQFYNERQGYSRIRSVVDAPVFAIQKEMDWNKNARPRILEKWKNLRQESGC